MMKDQGRRVSLWVVVKQRQSSQKKTECPKEVFTTMTKRLRRFVAASCSKIFDVDEVRDGAMRGV